MISKIISKSLLPVNGTLIDTTTLGQSVPGSKGNKGVTFHSLEHQNGSLTTV